MVPVSYSVDCLVAPRKRTAAISMASVGGAWPEHVEREKRQQEGHSTEWAARIMHPLTPIQKIPILCGVNLRRLVRWRQRFHIVFDSRL